VDRSALHALYAIPELSMQTLGDFTRRPVGEGEDADSRRIDGEALNEISNALDEAESLARTRSGED